MSATFDLWGGMRIPICMVSGPVNSGKTLFALTIDPNCRRPAAEVNATTIVWDQEGSADSYEGGLNFIHKDTRAAVAAGIHNRVLPVVASDPRWLQLLKGKADCNDSPAASMFRAWYLSLIDIQPGVFAVGVCDTFTPLQDGMIDWLKRHPEAFGRTANEYTKFSSATLWPDAKAMLSHILSVDCRLRFATFVMTVHLKNEWVGGGQNATKTGNKIAEGLDVLEKLATVHLELDRSPKAKGKDAPRVPAAIVKKERLVRFGATTDDDKPVLPPRIELCTPDQIRKYIVSPPDFSKLEASERLPAEQLLSDDQKLLIQQEIARNNVEDSTARLSALEMARAAAVQGQAMAAAQVAQSQPVQQSTQGGPSMHTEPLPPTQAVTLPAERPKVMSTPKQQADIIGLMKQLFKSGKQAQDWLLEHNSTNSPAELTDAEADGVLAALLTIKSELNKPTPPPPAAPVDAQADGRATKAQRDRIKELTIQVYGDQAAANQAGWLSTMGYQSAQSLTPLQAAERIADLERIACPKAPADDNLPF